MNKTPCVGGRAYRHRWLSVAAAVWTAGALVAADAPKVAANPAEADANCTYQENTKLPRATAATAAAAPLGKARASGPLFLQDHGNSVHFRNVRIVAK